MSRRKIINKRFPITDSTYNSYLVHLLLLRIMSSGKKSLAQKIIQDSFVIIQYKNDIISELHHELQRVKDAHVTMTQTYQSKLAVYGVPKEEMGFIPAAAPN